MRRVIAAALVLLFISLSNVYGDGIGARDHIKEFSLLKCVESSELVVVGRVTDKESVNYTTDITVAVDEVIKGTPNLGKDRVKFMIQGGLRMGRSDQPDFELGEQVLLFLTNGASKEPDNVHRQHDRYHLARGKYGKRLVVDNKVFIRYPASDNWTDYTLKTVKMPVDLAVELGKAFDRDKDAAIQLENTIKHLVKTSSFDLVTLNGATVNNLTSSAKEIAAPPEESN